MPFRRHSAPEGLPADLTPADTLGVYRTDGDGPRVAIYDQAFWRGGSFVGTPTRAAPPAVWTLLHELGHALARAPRHRRPDPADHDGPASAATTA